MANYYHFDRLSAQDASFLAFEGPNTPMHVCGMAIHEIGPLATPRGGVDIERVRRYINSRLNLIPRYRQRLAYTPIDGSPVWVDDENFNLSYHVRHACLPRPGTERQLKRLVARIFGQQLDRGKPLWESVIVEGLEGGRFAVLTKVHHCMVDGAAGIDLSMVLMSTTPDDRIEGETDWMPRPAPTPFQLLRDQAWRRVATPFAAARSLREALRDPSSVRDEAGEVLGALWDMLGTGLPGATETPLNQPVGPHRRLDWFSHDLDDFKFVTKRLGGTINDVVLAVVAGGLRRFFEQRRVDVDELDYRAAVPVDLRKASEKGRMGNRVSAWLMMLPVNESDPRRRLTKIRDLSADLKRSHQAVATERLTQLMDLTGSTALVSLGVKLLGSINPYNIIITNIRGPDAPLYMLGAKMLEAYPAMPLFENQGLAVAVVTYQGKIFCGLTADREMIPDLHDLLEAITGSIREMRQIAEGVTVELSSGKRSRAKTSGQRKRRATTRRANKKSGERSAKR